MIMLDIHAWPYMAVVLHYEILRFCIEQKHEKLGILENTWRHLKGALLFVRCHYLEVGKAAHTQALSRQR